MTSIISGISPVKIS